MIKSLIILIVALVLAPCFKAQTTRKGTVLKDSLYAPQLGYTKGIWIYLPPNYDFAKQRYPVLYLQDAQNLFDRNTSYSGEWGIDETMDSLYFKKKPMAIIVGIEHGGEKRINELTPFPHPKYKGGQGKAYLDFITNSLKPHIDKNYRTKTKKRHTYIGGSSLGGLISTFAVGYSNDYFSKALVFSPAYWINLQPLVSFISSSRNCHYSRKSLYIIQGSNESSTIEKDTREVVQHLQNNGLKRKNTASISDPNGVHNENFWRSEFARAYLWLWSL